MLQQTILTFKIEQRISSNNTGSLPTNHMQLAPSVTRGVLCGHAGATVATGGIAAASAAVQEYSSS